MERFEAIGNRFPGLPAAQKAKERLEELEKDD
jgi:TolA-binding protein